jgi:Asp-tRNA(Asn)/Glu-tRNA(Gln) amidotransferase A subunit family amidase
VAGPILLRFDLTAFVHAGFVVDLSQPVNTAAMRTLVDLVRLKEELLMPEVDLCFVSAADLAARLRARKVSPVEVIDALAERIKRLNPKLNAYVTLDLENARKDAQMKDRMRREHPEGDLGLLHGVPVAVKDDLEVAGLRYTCGSRLREKEIGKSDDLTVARLRRAGAIIVGKTNEPEFGHKGVTDNKLFGTTPTPWNREYTAGGSSGGSAAAVAAGMAYLALGTDIAGLIRIPASCCVVVGLKASFGRIPRVPTENAFVTQWYIGPLARTVADTALALRVLAGPDDRDPFSLPAPGEKELSLEGDLRGLRLTFCPRPTGMPVEPEVAEAAEKAVRLLEKRGVKVVPRKEPLPRAPLDALRVIFRATALTDAGIKDEADFKKKRDLLTDTFAAFVEPGLKQRLRDYLEAQAQVTTFLEQSAPDYWKDCDVLATPTLAVPPFSTRLPLGPEQVRGENVDPQVGWTFTWPFNLTGQPAISIPCGWTKDELPLGLQLVGRRSTDGLVLRMAAALEALAPGLTSGQGSNPTSERPRTATGPHALHSRPVLAFREGSSAHGRAGPPDAKG